jgi:hypothetical protein
MRDQIAVQKKSHIPAPQIQKKPGSNYKDLHVWNKSILKEKIRE